MKEEYKDAHDDLEGEGVAETLNKKVMCIETGITYPSIKEAMYKTGFKNISKVCNGKFKTCGGFHWRFVS